MTEVWRVGRYSSIVGLPITTQPDPTKNTVSVCVVHGEREEAEERARLIAAAPPMKEALEEAERFLDYFANNRTSFVGGGTPTSALAKVRAALAKEGA